MESRASARRIERRRGCGAGSWDVTARTRFRLRRLDSGPVAFLRHGRTEADLGNDPDERTYATGRSGAAAAVTYGDDWPDGSLRGRSHALVQHHPRGTSERAIYGA